MKNILIITLFLNFILASIYDAGDMVSEEDQYETFEFCNGVNPIDGNDQFSLSDYNGDLNGGHYYVFFIDMAASWCSPCFNYISESVDFAHQDWMIDQSEYNVIKLTSLADLGQPYTCSQWASFGSTDQNLIIDDSDWYIWDMFNTGNAVPSTVFIDHSMTVYDKGNQVPNSSINFRIQEMLNSCGDLCLADQEELLTGDSNYDGAVDIFDIIIMINQIIDGEYYQVSDLNQDGNLDILDIISVVNIILES